jgi:fibronectin-binding autotransporter adhesin
MNLVQLDLGIGRMNRRRRADRGGRSPVAARRVALVVAIAGCTTAIGTTGFAATVTWNNTSTDFNTGSDWNTGTVPGAGDTGTFTGPEVANPNLSATDTIQGLAFSTTNSSGYTLSGQALTLTNTGTALAYSGANTSGVNTISAPLILGGATSSTATFSQALGGTLNLSGGVTTTTSSSSGPQGLVLSGGTYNITAPLTLASANTTSTPGNLGVGTAASGTATVLNIASNISAVDLEVGNGTGASSGGAVYQSAGAVTLYDQTVSGGTAGPDKTFVLGGTGSQGSVGYGYYLAAGGSLTAPFMDVGGRTSGTVGVMDVEGGTITALGEINLNRGNTAGVAGYATLNVLGGSVNFDTFGPNPLVSSYTLMQTGYIAGSVTQITVGGGTSVAAINGGNYSASGIDLGQGSGATGAEDVLNINTNGVVAVARLFQTSSTPNGFLNFNGGTLRAVPNNSGGTFMNASSNVKYVTVFSGGGTVDNNGTNITIATPLLAPSGNGVTSVSVASGGLGYIGAPAVVFSGGGGQGATGYAVINSAGTLTNIVVSNPGTGYTSAPTVTLYGGGYTSAATPGTPTYAPDATTGGLTFTGNGITSLTGISTYGGPTTINAGSSLFVTGAVSNTSSISLASGSILGGTGTLSGSFNHTAGTIVGGASLNSPASGSLTFTGPVILNGGTVLSNINASTLNTGTVNQQGYINAAGGLTIGSTSETINLQLTNTVGSGTYVVNLFDYTTLSGSPNFTYISNLGRATFATDLSTPGEINVDISTSGPANLYWNSTSSGAWDVSLPSNASTGTANWYNSVTNAVSKFAQGDSVIFADPGTVVGPHTLPAPLQTNITINTVVTPSSVIVTSNTSNYTFSGSGGIGGIASVTLNGNSTLTLATSNTYTGGTNINGGILNLASNGSIGTASTISFGGGTLQYSASNNTDYSPQFSTASNQAIAIDTNGQSISFAANLTSSGGSLTKLGAGTLTLLGSNTYSGTTTITAGTLYLSSQTSANGGGAIAFNGGTLATPGITLSNPIVVNAAGGTLNNSNVSVFTGSITGSGTLYTSSAQPDVFIGSGFTPGNNSSSASFTGTIVSNYQLNITDVSASPYANYVAAAPGTNTIIFGDALIAPSGPVQMGSLSGVAGSSLRDGNNAAIGPVTYQIGSLNTNTTFAGSILNTYNGASGNITTITKVGTGNLTLTGSNSYTGGTNVGAGILTFAAVNAYPAQTALSIAQGAQVTLANHGTNSDFIPVISSLSNSGTIDLTNNGLDIQNGSISTVNSQVQAAYNSGAWNGTNASSGVITSSLAASDTTHLTAVGVATNLTTFEGLSVSSSDVLVKYTYYGDANLDGAVDGSDYSMIDNGYLNGLTGWQNGDFNYDGVVDGSDYTLIDNSFNMQGAQIAATTASLTSLISGSPAVSAVPEPASLGLLGIGAIGLLGRRGRASRRRRS